MAPSSSLAARVAVSGRRFAAIAFAGGMLGSGLLVWNASTAAFTGYTTNPTNSWTTGTVTLTDDDGGGSSTTGTAMFTATGLVPGAAAQYKCIAVTYGGNVAVNTAVKLYASASTDTDLLGQWIHLKIEEGTGGAFANNSATCNTNFTADANGAIYDSNGGGAGTGTAVHFLTNKNSYAAGVYNTTTPWAPSSSATKVYKFTYSLDSGTTDAFQNKNCQISFRWEARTA